MGEGDGLPVLGGVVGVVDAGLVGEGADQVDCGRVVGLGWFGLLHCGCVCFFVLLVIDSEENLISAKRKQNECQRL